MGETQRILIGIQNNDAQSLIIKNVTGAFVEEGAVGESNKYSQNFTIDSFNGLTLH